MAGSAFSNTVLCLNTPGYSGSAVELEFGLRNLAFQPLTSSLSMPSCIAWQVHILGLQQTWELLSPVPDTVQC